MERDISIYLLPGYYEDTSSFYPVIYFLHGYGGNNYQWTITSKDSKGVSIPIELIPKQILERVDLDRLINFEKIDELILSQTIRPFILVQPDGSFHIPNIFNLKNMKGKTSTKGSHYVNSPYTGNYRDCIVKDIVGYIDNNFRIIPSRTHRALMGCSMGGFGTIHIVSHHPDLFSVAVALSPGNLDAENKIYMQLINPLNVELFGKKIALDLGKKALKDIFDTIGLIFSNKNPLLHSIKCSEAGEILDYSRETFVNWTKNGLIALAE